MILERHTPSLVGVWGSKGLHTAKEKKLRSGFLNEQLTHNIVDKSIVDPTCILLTQTPIHTLSPSYATQAPPLSPLPNYPLSPQVDHLKFAWHKETQFIRTLCSMNSYDKRHRYYDNSIIFCVRYRFPVLHHTALIYPKA